MKKAVLLMLFIIVSFISPAQDTTGLIAHWKMNGNALDATGHGHNGTLRNVTNAAGKGGRANSALQFNGTTSYIMVPYSPSLDLTQFSICATVNIKGFYAGTCHGNTILQKGDGSPGNTSVYALNFTDYSCTSAFDTTNETFGIYAGDNGSGLPVSQWQFTPGLAENTWYSIVASFDGTTFKLYLNGVLKDSITGAGHTITANPDSLIIGMATWNALYPFPFKGIIDDIRLYNRALTTTEVYAYDTSTLAVPITMQNASQLSIYPNPAHNELYVSIEGKVNGVLSVINQLGQTVCSKEIKSNKEKLDIDALAAGMYFLRIENNAEIITKKFLKE